MDPYSGLPVANPNYVQYSYPEPPYNSTIPYTGQSHTGTTDIYPQSAFVPGYNYGGYWVPPSNNWFYPQTSTYSSPSSGYAVQDNFQHSDDHMPQDNTSLGVQWTPEPENPTNTEHKPELSENVFNNWDYNILEQPLQAAEVQNTQFASDGDIYYGSSTQRPVSTPEQVIRTKKIMLAVGMSGIAFFAVIFIIAIVLNKRRRDHEKRCQAIMVETGFVPSMDTMEKGTIFIEPQEKPTYLGTRPTSEKGNEEC